MGEKWATVKRILEAKTSTYEDILLFDFALFFYVSERK